MFQVPEKSPADENIPWDKITRGKKALLPAALIGMVTMGVWLFRDSSDALRYGVLVPGIVGTGFGAYALVQFKENGGSLFLRLAAFLIMSLSLFPVFDLMTWWTRH